MISAAEHFERKYKSLQLVASLAPSHTSAFRAMIALLPKRIKNSDPILLKKSAVINQAAVYKINQRNFLIMIKSPLRYPGGKSRAIPLLSGLIPHFTEYREPFVGGGSVFLYCKQMFPGRRYWINDLHPTLFSFWKMSQQDINTVVEKIYRWRNEYKEGKPLHRFLISNLPSFNELEMAAAFFIINRITFSGTTESGGFSQQAFEGRFTESSIHRLLPFGKLIQDARITHLDFEKVVTEDGKEVFIFLDPPYHSATKSALYGKNGNLHKGFDHIRFANAMKACPHKWLITYDDSPYIRELFSFANIRAWDLMYGMRNVTASSDQRGKELFISNYELG